MLADERLPRTATGFPSAFHFDVDPTRMLLRVVAEDIPRYASSGLKPRVLTNTDLLLHQ